MFDAILKRVPWVVAAVMLLAVTGQAALAGTDDGIDPSAVAKINADRVDGRHAIKYTSNTTARKGKLMAIGATGYLPNNIIQKATDADLIDGIDSTALATIAALQSSAGTVNEAGNLVHWNQLFGVPAGIADGADATGYYTFIWPTTPNVTQAGLWFYVTGVPTGVDVDLTFVPTDLNQWFEVREQWFQRESATTVEHAYWLVKQTAGTLPVKVRVRVSDQGIAPAALKKQAAGIKLTVSKRPPR